MEPGKTSFFQALGIPTKIARGTIEIVNDVQVVAAGSKVGSSEATLLNMLNISPFTYGMTVVQIYDNGAIFAPAILDIEEEELIGAFQSAIKTIAALSLATGLPTIASVMHSLVNTYKDVLAVAVATDIEFEAAAKVKEYLANPEAFAAAAPAAAAGGDSSAPAAEAAKEEEAEESDEDMGFDLFD